MNNCNRNQYPTTSVVLPGIRRVQVDSQTVGSPTIANITVPLASTEVSYALPTGSTRFRIRTRNSAKLQLAYVSGDSGTQFETIRPGVVLEEQGLDSTIAFTLYFQTPAAGTIVEIISWA
jgi:hypothetical protein